MTGRADTATPLSPRHALVSAVEDLEADPQTVRSSLTCLLTAHPRLGVSTALGLLSRPPRIKPSSHLLIDPDGRAVRHWSQRVAAAAALLESPSVALVFSELIDELAESEQFAADVFATVAIFGGLSTPQRAQLDHVRR